MLFLLNKFQSTRESTLEPIDPQESSNRNDLARNPKSSRFFFFCLFIETEKILITRVRPRYEQAQRKEPREQIRLEWRNVKKERREIKKKRGKTSMKVFGNLVKPWRFP